MSSVYAKIVEMLEDSIERLQKDLLPLEQQMLVADDGIFITYDDGDNNNPFIIVYSPDKYRAYIPKKYDGWAVKFIEWNGEDIQLSYDQTISFN